MMAEEVEEAESLQQEYEWILREEVQQVAKNVAAILLEASKRFPIQTAPGDNDNMVKPERFILSSPDGTQHVKCMVTLMGDTVCEADLALKIHKQQAVPIKSNIFPDMPWKIQQIQDAGNHLLEALQCIEEGLAHSSLQTGEQVLKVLDTAMGYLQRGRSCLALPKKRTLDELIKNQNMKSFKPNLPNDTTLSFYVQAQKLVLAVYLLYVNQAQKVDISARYQVECQVPWLNDTLVFFSVALQQCQQLRDKVVVFQQYEEEVKLLLAEKQVFCGQ